MWAHLDGVAAQMVQPLIRFHISAGGRTAFARLAAAPHRIIAAFVQAGDVDYLGLEAAGFGAGQRQGSKAHERLSAGEEMGDTAAGRSGCMGGQHGTSDDGQQCDGRGPDKARKKGREPFGRAP